MKVSTLTSSLAGAGVALWLTLALAMPAQEPPAEAPPPAEVPAAETAPAEPEAPTPPAPPPSEELRRLDEPISAEAPAAPDVASTTEAPTPPAETRRGSGRRSQHREMVRFFSDALLPADESASEVVAIMGSVVADGHVAGAAVAIMGDTTVNGESREAVAVMGSVTVNGRVRGDVVAVMGNVQFGPNAIVDGDVVSVGGRVDRAPGAVIHGEVQQIGPFPIISDGLDGLRVWFRTCLALGRPLAFDHRVIWAWGIAAVFIGIYLFIALLFNRSVIACAETLEQRPGMTVVAAVVTAFAAPILTILLSFIGIGLLLIPLFFLAGLYGKATFLAWLGRRATLPLGWHHSFPAVLIGSVILLLMYTVPFLGFVMMKLTTSLGLGMVVYTIILANRQSPPAPAAPGVIPAAAPPATPAPTAPYAFTPAPLAATGSSAAVGATAAATEPGVGSLPVSPDPSGTVPSPMPASAAAPTFAPTASIPPALPVSYATLPRVGFWLRLGASLLDVILVAIVLGMIGLRDYLPVFFAAYCVVLWSLRATTIGGIICGLKVVRLDERKIDWSIALVRALGGFLSLAVLGLGFIWVAFDKERQSWHDKIAGTVIVRVPKGVTLV
jgi:uncharacterized RDD family membrane protein YckC